jgi:hypothetical protein
MIFVCEDSIFSGPPRGNHGKSIVFQGLDFVLQTCLVQKLGESLQVVDAVVAGEAAVARSMQEPGLCYQWNMDEYGDLDGFRDLDVYTIYINL